MTVALPMAWTGIVLGGVAFLYTLVRDIVDGPRVNRLEKLAKGLRGDITDMSRDLNALRKRISDLEDAATMPRQPAESPPEPRTAPIRLPVPGRAVTKRTESRTDTDHSHTVIGREHLALADSYGRHHAHGATW